VVESQKSDKKSKYTIDSIQRKALISRIYPILLVGSIVWLSGEYLFSFLFSDLDFTGQSLLYYVIIVIVEAILIFSFFFTSNNNKILLSVLFFIAFSFLAGILSLPVVIFTEFIPQVHMLVSLSVGASFIVFSITLFLRDKYFAKGSIWAHIIIYLIGVAIVEIIFIVIFNIQNLLLTIPISLAYILVVSLVLMFWGTRTIKNSENENWIYSLFKILGILLLALVLAVVVVVVVLIIIALAIASEGALDLSGLGTGGTGRKKKAKQQI
jgi:FtsH-binding integral membrane protein